MSANTETKPEPVGEQVTTSKSEPTVAREEKDLGPQPQDTHGESAPEKTKSTYSEMATTAATSATSAAVGVKDNVFSMFGGGAKKEKKVEPEDDVHEASGSSKAQKAAEADAEAEGEVGQLFPRVTLVSPSGLTLIRLTRTRRQNPQMFISSLSFA